MQIITNQFQKELKEHGNYQFPVLISYEQLLKYEAGSFIWHWHPEIELTLIKKGQMVYKVNDKIYYLKQGEALFGNTGVLHTGYMYENQDCEYVSITFDSKLIYGYENSILYLKYVSPVIQNFSLSAVHFDLSAKWHKDIIDIINDVVNIGRQQYNSYEIDILIRLQQFWKLLFLNCHSASAIPSYDKRNYDRIRNILTYIEENYSNKLTLEDIAEHIHLCKGECCRIFKQYMKIPLFKFIMEYRIEKSLYYLINSDISIGDVAVNVGFSDSNYYSHAFFKIKGCSPTKYRKNIIDQNKIS